MNRTTVKATYLGKVITWPVDEITHFESAHKYTVAHRADGKELLIVDSMKSLAIEFRDRFIMVRRGMLVARELIISAHKWPDRAEGYIRLSINPSEMLCGRQYIMDVKRYLQSRSTQDV